MGTAPEEVRDSAAEDLPRSMHPTLTRDPELRVANGREFLMGVRPEFERCRRYEKVDDVHSVGSGVGGMSPEKGMCIASRQVWVGGMGRGAAGKGTQLMGEWFS